MIIKVKNFTHCLQGICFQTQVLTRCYHVISMNQFPTMSGRHSLNEERNFLPYLKMNKGPVLRNSYLDTQVLFKMGGLHKARYQDL